MAWLQNLEIRTIYYISSPGGGLSPTESFLHKGPSVREKGPSINNASPKKEKSGSMKQHELFTSTSPLTDEIFPLLFLGSP